jgi:Fe2+ transport system protein FeoA
MSPLMTTQGIAPVKTDTLPLIMAWPGPIFRVTCLDCGELAARRLTELGMVPGARIEVLRAGRFGSLIVKVDSCRLGLGRGLAAKVILTPVAEAATGPAAEGR